MTTQLPMFHPEFQASSMQEMNSGSKTKKWTLSYKNAPTEQKLKKMAIAQTHSGLRQESGPMSTIWESKFQELAIADNQVALFRAVRKFSTTKAMLSTLTSSMKKPQLSNHFFLKLCLLNELIRNTAPSEILNNSFTLLL
jgi:hypothetical protein